MFLKNKTNIPKLSKATKRKVQGIAPETLANIYIQPEGIVKTMNTIFSEFKWIADSTMYPKDWIYSPKKKSIFERKFFHISAILNPPYAEVIQKSSPRAKDEKPLKFHVAHILKVARASQIPTAILLPTRKDKNWYKKLLKQPDVTTVHLTTELTFKNMDNKYMPQANFKSFLAVVGFQKERILIKNNPRGFIMSVQSRH